MFTNKKCSRTNNHGNRSFKYIAKILQLKKKKKTAPFLKTECVIEWENINSPDEWS